MLRLAIAYSSRKKSSLAHFRETESASHQERESDDGIVRFHIAAVSVPLSSRRLNGGAGARSFNKAQKWSRKSARTSATQPCFSSYSCHRSSESELAPNRRDQKQSKTRPSDGQTSKVLHLHHVTKRKHRSELSKRTITPNYVRLSNYARQQ